MCWNLTFATTQVIVLSTSECVGEGYKRGRKMVSRCFPQRQDTHRNIRVGRTILDAPSATLWECPFPDVHYADTQLSITRAFPDVYKMTLEKGLFFDANSVR